MNADANRDFRWKRREALGSRAFGWPERALGWLSQVGFSLGSVANIVGAALRGRPWLAMWPEIRIVGPP